MPISQLKLNLVTIQKILYVGNISLCKSTKTVNLKNIEGIFFPSVFYKPQESPL